MGVERPVSLSGNDFYPLINSCTKWMTYDEKVAHGAKHGVPRTIDRWIADGKTRTKAPTANPFKRGPTLEYLLWQDDVECILNVIQKIGLVEGGVQEPDEFTLTLGVRVPPTAGFLIYYWESPTVVIDQYTGDSHDELSPEWLQTVQADHRFWQSRTLMLEMMLYFVRNIPHNSGVSKRVTSWCKAMSTPTSGLSTSIRPRPYFDPISPRNTRRHKPRASDLSAEDAQKLRKVLNEGSPLPLWRRV
ncbi:hypothetical protein GALMADRAFT_141676 [Galerina marginata CBS 339.88]|uniref:Uncharacterized protein n=1 Tax=Galerina marginata (strain CBS 339.88) TaxID=685588 RepID=A0A067SSN9_GALM3|nr:hypothetical protein GALMADRAFT_141676 [Galerina marginata CBS 339.88]